MNTVMYLMNNNFGPTSPGIYGGSVRSCAAAPTQCVDNGYAPYYACIDKSDPDKGVECKKECPIPKSGSIKITSDCTLYHQINVTGTLSVTGVPDALGIPPKISGGGSNRLFQVEGGGNLSLSFLTLIGGNCGVAECDGGAARGRGLGHCELPKSRSV